MSLTSVETIGSETSRGDLDGLRHQITELRAAQSLWKTRCVRSRAKICQKVAALISERSFTLGAAIESPQRNGFRETLSSELIPLADAAAWLAKASSRILQPRRLSRRAQPYWLGRVKTQIVREPLGIVLILGTWNYPLFLTGVQMLHALVAGNAVLIKPAPSSERIIQLWLELLADAGFPTALMLALPSDVAKARAAIEIGVDKVVLTGSSSTGRDVLSQLASKLTPAVMELSGCDAMVVLPSADLNRVVPSFVFGLTLNSGATCMAPRRVLVHESLQTELEQRLLHAAGQIPVRPLSSGTYAKLNMAIQQAMEQGARVVGRFGPSESSSLFHGPIVLADVRPDMLIAKLDVFAPLVMLMTTKDEQDAIHQNAACPYSLSASVFGDADAAQRIAKQLHVGFVSINDLIVPSVDPRIPFGGRHESGYGVTRGEEGLLEMTVVKTISQRLGRFLPHLDASQPSDEELLRGILSFSHGGTWRTRWQGLCGIVQAVRRRTKPEGAKK